jgi:hypothetical protein
VASNSMQRTLSAVWQVAWIIGFLRSLANNLRQHCTSEFHIVASHALRL